MAPYGHPVRMSLVRFTSYALLFFGLLHVINSRKRLHVLVLFLIGIALFQALYGFVQAFSENSHIWWVKKGLEYSVTGTFYNKNNFAAYMMMITLLAIGYAAASRPKRRVKGRWVGRISLSLEENSRRFLIIFISSFLFIALIFSRSRGGITSFLIALCLLGILFLLKKGKRASGGLLLSLIVITSVYALQIGMEPVIDRFRHLDITENPRIRYTERTLEMARDFFVTGIGVGNFQYAYPKYQAPEDMKGFIRFAHNDWAQSFSEGGVVGLVLIVGTLLFFLYRFFRALWTRSDPFIVYLSMGTIAALLSIIIHSFVAFDLHIPAIPLTLSAILVIGSVAVHLQRRRPRDRFLYRYLKKDRPVRFNLFLIFITVVTCVNGWWAIKHFMAEAYCHTVPNPTLNRDENPPLEKIKKAIGWDSGNAAYWYKMAAELSRIRNAQLGIRNAEELEGKQLEIVKVLEEAVRLNPFNAQYHHRLGWEYTYLWQHPDYHKRWLPAADIAMDRATYFAGEKTPRIHVDLGNYWVMRSKTITPANPDWITAWTKACWHYKKAQELDGSHEMVKTIIKYIWNFYPDREMVLETIHPKFLERAGKVLGASK
ncbi:MAG: O-antigen ligase family protein [Pseudomonadota bacterium]